MANQITDNRTLISSNDTNSNIVNEVGASSGTTNTETFIQGSGSVSSKVSATATGLFYDFGSNQNFSNNTFYLWWLVATAGKLQTRANGGVRIRFAAGVAAVNYFEIYVAGRDTYSGGWEMSVIDIERAYTAAVTNGDPNTGTGGTPPATSAIQYVGVYFDVNAMISGNVDNCFIDAFWRLPSSTPGIIVEGRNAGTTDWTFQDIFDAGDPGDTTKAWGTGFVESNGSLSFNTPIQIGIDDTSTHAFSDTNAIVGWQDQFVDLTGFYNITLVGDSSVGGGTTDFELGVVSGSGDDRVGTQGGVIFAKDTGARWSLIADDAFVTSCNLYGVQMIHGEDFQLDTSACTTINSTFLDCTSATVSNGKILKCNIIDANTADDVAFMFTDDLTDIVRTNFIFSDGHAVQLDTPRVATQTSKGNAFTGYGATTSTDAAIYNQTAGAVEINVSDGGDTPTYKDGASASTTVNNPKAFSITNIVPDSELRIYDASDTTTEFGGIESVTGSLQNFIILNGGTGYSVSDVLTLDGGTFSTAAQITVSSVSSGVITEATISTPGTYTVRPGVPTTLSGGTGSGATINPNISGSFTYNYNYTADTPVIVVAFHLSFKDLRLTTASLLNSDQSIPIQQIADRVYINP